MAFPQILDPTSPLGSDSPRFGDDQIRAFKQFLADLFTLPVAPSTISATIGSVSTAGKLTITNGLWNGDAIPAAYGGTGLTTYTIGDIAYASGATALSKLADVAVGSYLRSGGVATAPLWSTLTLPNTSTAGDLLASTGTNAIGSIADVAVGSFLQSGGVGVIPSWSQVLAAGSTVAALPAAGTAGRLRRLTDGGANGSLVQDDGVNWTSVEAKSLKWYVVTAPPYNAKGDGVTDDAAAIQAAVNAIPAGSPGGIVYLPAGIYNISTEISIPRSQIWIIGAGPDQTIVQTTNATINGFHFGNGTGHCCGGIFGVQVTSTVTKTAGSGIFFDNFGTGTIERFNISGHFIGINLSSANTVRVHRGLIQNIITATGVGLLINGSNDQYIDNVFIKGVSSVSQPLAGIQIVSTGAARITHTDVLNGGTGFLINPTGTNQVNDLFLANNTFDSCSSAGLQINPSVSAMVRYVVSTGDWYSSNTSHGVQLTGAGIIEDVRFIGARVFNNAGHGFSLEAGTNLYISNSTIAQNSITVTGTKSGIFAAAGLGQFSLLGNRIGQTPSFTNTQKYGIEITAGVGNQYLVQGNDLRNNLTGPLLNGGTGTTQQVFGNLPSLTQPEHIGQEGTWTPVLTFTTPGNLAVTYSSQYGSYTKIGRLVTVTGNITTSAFTYTTASGALNITGLPFTSANDANQIEVGSLVFQGITQGAAFTQLTLRVQGNSTLFDVVKSGSGVGIAQVATTDMPSGGSVILYFTLTYHTP